MPLLSWFGISAGGTVSSDDTRRDVRRPFAQLNLRRERQAEAIGRRTVNASMRGRFRVPRLGAHRLSADTVAGSMG
jgi:hypothetical protein